VLLHSPTSRAQPAGATDGELPEPLQDCSKAKGRITVSFKPSVGLEELVSWAMSFSCKTFFYRTELKRLHTQIEILAPLKLSPAQSWQLFQSSLRAMGLTLVSKGKVINIVQATNAPQQPLPLRKSASGGERIERLVVVPEHLQVEDAKVALEALASKEGKIVALQSASALLVTDYGSHTANMMKLLRRVDQPAAHQALYAIHTRFADVEVVRETLISLLDQAVAGNGKDKSGRAPPVLVADPRTGTLFLRSSEATYKRALSIVRNIDVELEGDATGRLHVFPLSNADSEKLATTLSTLLSQRGPATAPARGQKGKRAVAGGSSGAVVQGQVRVTHDAETNSLLLLASARDYQGLTPLIEKLDQPRRQVFLEATIMEIDMDNLRDIGAAGHVGGGKDRTWFGGLQQEGLRTVGPREKLAENLGQTGLLAGIIGESLSEPLLGMTIPSMGVLFHALAEESVVDILSSPQLMTSNNTEAKLAVGQNVPFQSGFTAGVTPGVGSQNIDRADIEMVLKVKPHVNEGNLIRLDIDLKIKELLPNQEQLQPSWTTREVVNTVVVSDQESIVIGGLVSSKESETVHKIPLLGDIPLLGRLFRSTRTESSRKNLIILLTPYVLSGPAEAAALARQRLAERERFLEQHRRLQSAKFSSEIDYRRKRGLIADIDQAIRQEERKRALLDELEAAEPPPQSGRLE
jgi:general secretion pathway protein D